MDAEFDDRVYTHCGDCNAELRPDDREALRAGVCEGCRDKFFREVGVLQEDATLTPSDIMAATDLIDDYAVVGVTSVHDMLVIKIAGPTPDQSVVFSGRAEHFHRFIGRLNYEVYRLATKLKDK